MSRYFKADLNIGTKLFETVFKTAGTCVNGFICTSSLASFHTRFGILLKDCSLRVIAFIRSRSGSSVESPLKIKSTSGY